MIVRDAYKISQVSRRPVGWLKMKNLDAPAVEKKTASELAEIVATRIARSRVWMARNGHWPTRHSEQIPTAG